MVIYLCVHWNVFVNRSACLCKLNIFVNLCVCVCESVCICNYWDWSEPIRIHQNESKVIHKQTDLHRQEVTDERHEYHVFTVPHLLSVDLYSAAELPPLATVLHEDLNTHTSVSVVHVCIEQLFSNFFCHAPLRRKKDVRAPQQNCN